MQLFHNILFISNGVQDEVAALKQALSFTRNNKATLKALIVCPQWPDATIEYKDQYETSLKEHMQKSIQIARDSLKLSEADMPVTIELESGETPAIRIIRHVLRGAHDLVIKGADPIEEHKGFKAIDMALLRQCPCPVWLCRPIEHHSNKIHVAVAIDPESVTPEGHDLSIRLLTLSRALADTCSGELSIISCWSYEFEEYLRNSIRSKIADDELLNIVMEAQRQHRTALDALIHQSKIEGKIQVHHVKGDTDQMIPKYIENKKVDILVMGTIARTGIAGFLIGNTAENIVQQLECSLLALKPNGFISPVKAY